MKIINEKGKLFGIINVIDLAVLLVIVLMAGAIGYKVLSPRIQPQSVETRDVTFVVKITLKPRHYLDAINKGDKIVSGIYETDAYIEDIQINPGQMTATTADGEIRYPSHPTLYDAYVRIKMKARADTTVLKLGVQEVRIGAKYQLKTRKVDMEGIVDNIEF